MADLSNALRAFINAPETEEEEEAPTVQSVLRDQIGERNRRDRGIARAATPDAPLTRAFGETVQTVGRAGGAIADAFRGNIGEPSTAQNISRAVEQYGADKVREANQVSGDLIEPGVSAPPEVGMISSTAETLRDIPSSYKRSILGAIEGTTETVVDPILGTNLTEGIREQRLDEQGPTTRPEGFGAELLSGITKMVGDLPKYAHPGLVLGDVAQAGYTESRDRGDTMGESVTNAMAKGTLQALTLRMFNVLPTVTGATNRSLTKAGLSEFGDEATNTLGGQILDVATSKSVEWDSWETYIKNALKSGVIGFAGGGALRGIMNATTDEEIDATAKSFIGAKVADLESPDGISFADFRDRTGESGDGLGSVLGSLQFFRENFANGKDLEIELKTGPSNAKGEFDESNGKITLFVDNLKDADPRKTVSTLFHEGTGHAMGEALMGKDKFQEFKNLIKENQPEWVQGVIAAEAADSVLEDGNTLPGRQITEDDAIEEYFPYWLEGNWEKGGTTASVFKAKAIQVLSKLTNTPKDKTEVFMQEALRDFKNKKAIERTGSVSGEEIRRKSLTPTSEGYTNDAKLSELQERYPHFWRGQDQSETDKTQRDGTRKTMQKIVDALEIEGVTGGKALDVSAGLGINADVMKEKGFEVETSEPNPAQGRDKFGFEPNYKFSSDIEGSEKYDLITNTAVLNVLPSGPREGVVADIGRLLNVGGTGVITVRNRGGSDVDALAKSATAISLGDGQYITKNGEYQRGFTAPELQEFTQKVLDGEYGAGKFDVSVGRLGEGKGKVSPPHVIIKKTQPIKTVRKSLNELSKHPIYESTEPSKDNIPFRAKAGRSFFGTDAAITSMGGDLAQDVLNARAIQRGVAGAIDQVLNYSGVTLDDSGAFVPNPDVPAINDLIGHTKQEREDFLNTVGELQYRQDQIKLAETNDQFERLSSEESELSTDLAMAESTLLHRQSKSEIRATLKDIKAKQSQIEDINRKIKEPKRKDVTELKKQRAELRLDQRKLQNFLTVKQSSKLAMRIAKSEARLENLYQRAEDMTSEDIEDNIDLMKLEVQDIKSKIRDGGNEKTSEFLKLNNDIIRYNEEMVRLAVRNATGVQENIQDEWVDLQTKMKGALAQRKKVATDLRGEGKDVAGNTIKAAEELTDAKRELKSLRARSKEDPRIIEQISETEDKINSLREEFESNQPDAKTIRALSKIREEIGKITSDLEREKRLSETETERTTFRNDMNSLKSRYRKEMSEEISGLVNPFTKQEKREAYRLSTRLRKQLSEVRHRRRRAEKLLRSGKAGTVGPEMRTLLKDYEGAGSQELLDGIKKINESTKNMLIKSGVIKEEQAEQFDVENYFTASRHSPLFKDSTADVLKQRKGGSDKLFTDPSAIRGIQAKLTQLAVDTIAKRRTMELLSSMGVVSDPQPESFEVGTLTDSYHDEKGNVMNVQVLDKPTYEALSQTSDAYTIPVVSTFRDILRAGVTNTPDFAGRQFVADSIATGLLRKEMIPVVDSVLGLWKAGFDRKLVREYKTAGGEMGHNYDIQTNTDPAKRARLNNNPVYKWSAGLYQELLAGGELANRLRLFEKLLADPTKTRADAVFAARTLGADFGRRAEGTLPKVMNAMIPFHNAALQASHSLIEHVKRDPITPLFRTTLSVAGYMTLRALNYAMFDEDEWKDMNESLTAQDKVTNFYVYTRGEDGEPVRWKIPRDRNLGAVGALAEVYFDNLKGRDKQDMAKLLIAVAEAQVNTSVIPQILKPGIEAVTGFDMYRGRYFVQPGKKGLPEDDFSDYTSELMKYLGRATGLSPQRLEHAFKGYTGTVGTLALAQSDAMLSKLGVIPETVDPRYVGPISSGLLRIAEHTGGRSDKQVGEYYELVRKIEDVNSSYTQSLEGGDDERLTELEERFESDINNISYVRSLTRPSKNLMKIFSQELKDIRADEKLSGKEKMAAMRKIYKERNEYVREVNAEIRPTTR